MKREMIESLKLTLCRHLVAERGYCIRLTAYLRHSNVERNKEIKSSTQSQTRDVQTVNKIIYACFLNENHLIP